MKSKCNRWWLMEFRLFWISIKSKFRQSAKRVSNNYLSIVLIWISLQSFLSEKLIARNLVELWKLKSNHCTQKSVLEFWTFPSFSRQKQKKYSKAQKLKWYYLAYSNLWNNIFDHHPNWKSLISNKRKA